jgi:hypothetical protein
MKSLPVCRIYIHIDARQITDVVKAQQAISGTAEKVPTANNTPILKIVKMPENEDSQARKLA